MKNVMNYILGCDIKSAKWHPGQILLPKIIFVLNKIVGNLKWFGSVQCIIGLAVTDPVHLY